LLADTTIQKYAPGKTGHRWKMSNLVIFILHDCYGTKVLLSSKHCPSVEPSSSSFDNANLPRMSLFSQQKLAASQVKSSQIASFFRSCFANFDSLSSNDSRLVTNLTRSYCLADCDFFVKNMDLG